MSGHITPLFQCSQNDAFVNFTIRVPYAKADEMEFYAIDNEFVFYSKPYFLRLYLPGDLIEDGREKGSYDWNTNEVKISIPKKNQKEYFPDLDMISKLLAKKDERKNKEMNLEESAAPTDMTEGKKPIIEELSSTEIECEFEQNLPEEEEEKDVKQSLRYGFDNKYYSVFSTFGHSSLEIIEFDNPDDIELEKRIDAMRIREEDKFNRDQMLYDWIDEQKWMRANQFEKSKILGKNKVITCTNEEEKNASSEDDDSESELELDEYEEGDENYLLDSALQFVQPWNCCREKNGLHSLQFHCLPYESDPSKEKLSVSSPSPLSSAANPSELSFSSVSQSSSASPSSSSSSTSPSSSTSTSSSSSSTRFESPISITSTPSATPSFSASSPFSDLLLSLPRRVVVPAFHPRSVLYSLFDLMFAFCYDMRLSEGEGNPESMWTYTTLSPTLSNLISYTSLRSAVLSCLRRCLVFPLFRGPLFASMVLNDTITLFCPHKRPTAAAPSSEASQSSSSENSESEAKSSQPSLFASCLFGGSVRRDLLLCLLRMKYVLDRDSAKYLLSKLYLNDYCLFVQQISEKELEDWCTSKEFEESVDIQWNRDADEIAPGWRLSEILRKHLA
ncbi:putative protein SHQ1 [Monocercomonoides exilis]|uniref:putative protein SHQ1 n=1 Tax=Monocercomonoides exilis TaxID=2049356 RepID=UPI0035594ECA|nr:putative protein SHQ1 [Monocercomonoides exilis]|eukprot:MONOS_9731.1-p1 / transcript=MONOS_9731.1 / gene=MONOS_9731 / organism=Monocercomonoides_exilis_PA203 / gene_product=protein SHQ1 homolog / transcript_product=protein SHQ1 homolog / location=Mono_scaffold00413:16121-18386(-) / protein_length=616 / sequence_SO=supercontig / SO=protein_coding / is_pseudo=false